MKLSRWDILVRCLVAAAGGLMSSSAATLRLEQLEIRQRPTTVLNQSFFKASPATMQWLDSITISSVSAQYESFSLSNPIMQEDGTGHSGWKVDARSYYRLSDKSALWGSASYSSYVTHDVRWSNAIDYQLLTPYVLGDSVGGNMQSQRYMFSGGWSRLYGRYAVGVEAVYRAEIAYRSRDPRVHDIVSDLNVRAAAAWKATDCYSVGAGLGVRTYKQISDVEFVNLMNDIQTYPLTGLGSYYHRFVGNNNRSA
ncbi:MAG: hypothetical protein K2J06_03675, partial [Muribaculaceae bacterium]|nr:hypothetical protein [Muribaculaceae bacterium]